MTPVTFTLYTDIPIVCKGDDVDALVGKLGIRNNSGPFDGEIQLLPPPYDGYLQIGEVV